MDNVEEAPRAPIQPSLLILAKSERSIKSTLAFLNRRGIPARTISTLNEAIEAFTAKEANMLLLSVNFPHPKIEMIPVLMHQSFPIAEDFSCILFAEDTDRKSNQRLQNSRSKHVLMGQVSGPVVMMKIKQIERELNNTGEVATDASGNRSVRSAEQDSSINVRGSSDKVRQEALANLMKAATEPVIDEDDFDSSSGLQRSGETYVDKGTRSKAHASTPGDALRAALANGLEAAEGLKAKLILPLPAELRRNGRSNSESSDKEMTARELADEKKAQDAKARARAEAQSHGGSQEPDKRAREKIAREKTEQQAKQVAEAKAKEAAELAAASDRLREKTSRRKSAETPEEDLFLRCLVDAFETVAGEPTEGIIGIRGLRKSMLVAVRSPRMRCAFLVAVGHSKHKPVDLMERMQIAFFSLLRVNGIELEGQEQFAIEIDELTIANRSFESSQFILVSRGEDAELGVAVVSSGDPVPNFEPYERNMLQVPLTDILADEPMTFNLFLHLQRNDKFIRYIKVGASISERQVAKLGRKKITHVLVDGKELDAYSRHFAAHSIEPSRRKRAA